MLQNNCIRMGLRSFLRITAVHTIMNYFVFFMYHCSLLKIHRQKSNRTPNTLYMYQVYPPGRFLSTKHTRVVIVKNKFSRWIQILQIHLPTQDPSQHWTIGPNYFECNDPYPATTLSEDIHFQVKEGTINSAVKSEFPCILLWIKLSSHFTILGLYPKLKRRDFEVGVRLFFLQSVLFILVIIQGKCLKLSYSTHHRCILQYIIY